MSKIQKSKDTLNLIKFIISPFSIMGAQVFLETKHMAPDRIEGNLIAVSYRHQWFVVRK